MNPECVCPDTSLINRPRSKWASDKYTYTWYTSVYIYHAMGESAVYRVKTQVGHPVPLVSGINRSLFCSGFRFYVGIFFLGGRYCCTTLTGNISPVRTLIPMPNGAYISGESGTVVSIPQNIHTSDRSSTDHDLPIDIFTWRIDLFPSLYDLVHVRTLPHVGGWDPYKPHDLRGTCFLSWICTLCRQIMRNLSQRQVGAELDDLYV